MTNPPDIEKTVIGWREFASLPEWGVSYIKAKADTGARTSVIDVANILELPGDVVRFELVVDRRDPEARVVVETPVVRRATVKSSFGAAHDRLLVKTRIRLGTIEKEVELGLVSRRNMLCRMLLGRRTLKPEMIVDPSRRYVLGKRPRRRTREAGMTERP